MSSVDFPPGCVDYPPLFKMLVGGLAMLKLPVGLSECVSHKLWIHELGLLIMWNFECSHLVHMDFIHLQKHVRGLISST